MKLKLLLLAGLAASSPGEAADGFLVIDKAHSRVEITVKATVDSFVATLSDFDATVSVDPTAGRVLSATFAFRFADVLTGRKDRDHEMLIWEEAGQFPEGRFELVSIEPGPAGGHLARGRLVLHGVTRDLGFPVTVSADHRLYAIDGNVMLDTRDFGLGVIRKLLVLKVDPHVQVRFHLQGTVGSP